MEGIERVAKSNLIKFRNNPYQGRGFITGLNETGTYLIQAYFIAGRSAGSRNRRFAVKATGDVRTEPIDPALVKDPELTLYTAMSGKEHWHVASNGNQTDTILDTLGHQQFFRIACDFDYEPDAPHYTPRISTVGRVDHGHACVEISIVRRCPLVGRIQSHFHYRQDSLLPGYGYCVHTYEGTGDPLPSFQGEPRILPIPGRLASQIEGQPPLIDYIWDQLSPDTRLALAVKAIRMDTGVVEYLETRQAA